MDRALAEVPQHASASYESVAGHQSEIATSWQTKMACSEEPHWSAHRDADGGRMDPHVGYEMAPSRS